MLLLPLVQFVSLTARLIDATQEQKVNSSATTTVTNKKHFVSIIILVTKVVDKIIELS